MRKERKPAGRQAGLTLVELMVSITLGLLVVMAATALLLSAKSGYAAVDDNARLQDTGRYALDVVSRAVRQAAYENWDREEAPIVEAASIMGSVSGLDASRLPKLTEGIDGAIHSPVNGSDVLAIRFFGAGKEKEGDGSVVNCAGFSVPAATSQGDAEKERGWSVFFVDIDAAGEPQLYCKYRGKNQDADTWKSEAIASGVESFQVLYGLDTDGDASPNRLLTAAAINAMDDALVLEGEGAARVRDRNRKTHWKKVVLVRVALLLRGSGSTRVENPDARYALFGSDYADARGGTDIGTSISETDLPASTRNRMRKVFTATVQLRNQAGGSGL